MPFTQPPPWKNRTVPRESSHTLRPSASEKSKSSGVNTRSGTSKPSGMTAVASSMRHRGLGSMSLALTSSAKR